MNCPRCTDSLPEGSRYCPKCGLDLEQVLEGGAAEGGDQSADDAEIAEPVVEVAGENIWPKWLRIHSTLTPKKPTLAAVLAFFFGPFTYLYLEQTAWFLWGLLAGIAFGIWSLTQFVIAIDSGRFTDLMLAFCIGGIPVIGFMLHAWDVAKILNQRLDETGADTQGSLVMDEESV
jgi:hypothetical protein